MENQCANNTNTTNDTNLLTVACAPKEMRNHVSATNIKQDCLLKRIQVYLAH